jgi:hypothetical protein
MEFANSILLAEGTPFIDISYGALVSKAIRACRYGGVLGA